ncbi:Nuclear import receptor [Mycoemilia scoparia]|uniref:Nuclear import receptor n=1 Tax=Mycoemilia scoparia TaxID=417184 RepID=A0A9W8A3W9_9FUNG|nr:Nuclear import receptor [Mycoemilia scoparia]
MSQSDISQVISILETLYKNSDPSAKKQANDWLQDFQKKPEAWMVVDTILRTPLSELQAEAKMFSAQTLRNKIINDLSDLDSSAVNSLKDSLIAHLKDAQSQPQSLIIQLCLSLAGIAVQSEAWADPVAEIIQQLSSDPFQIACLLEFLTVLPEEMMNERIIVSNSLFQDKSTKLLTDQAGNVIQLMVQCLQSTNLDANSHVRVLGCFNSWLKSGELTVDMIRDTPLIDLAFAALDASDNSIFETASDAVCNIIYETRDEAQVTSRGHHYSEQTNITQILLPKLASVAERMRSDKAILEENDEDRMRGYCRIFTEAGESWIYLITRFPEVFEKILAALLDCMKMPNLEIIRMLFNFWGDLSDNVLSNTEHRGHEHIRSSFSAVFESLIDIIIVHQRYPLGFDGFSLPADDSGDWSLQERDEFRDFRHNVGDVLKDCVRVVGEQVALIHPYQIISSKLSSAGSSQSVPWQEIEAPLFSLRSMGAEISPYEDNVMPKIMDIFSNFPTHPKLRYAATLVIGRYTEWTDRHPQYVEFQLKYVFEGFQDKDVAPASALAIKYLCKDCNIHLVPVWSELIGFYYQAFPGDILDDMDILQITEGLAHVINAMPDENTPTALEQLILPMISRLGEKIAAGANITENDKLDIARLVDRMGILFEFVELSKNSPGIAVLDQASVSFCQTLTQITGLFPSHPILSESVGKALRSIFDRHNLAIKDLVPNIAESLVTAFRQTGLGVYLWASRKFIKVYDNATREIWNGNTTIEQIVLTMVQSISETTLQALQGPESAQTHPEIIDEYFKLLVLVLEGFSKQLIRASIFPSIFKFGVSALSVRQVHALDSVEYFWSRLTAQAMRHLSSIKRSQEIVINSSEPHFPTLRSGTNNRQKREENDYPLDIIVRLFASEGYSIVNALFDGFLHTFPPECLKEASNSLVFIAKIIHTGPQLIAIQNLPATSHLQNYIQWINSIVSQIPDSNMPARDRELFVADLSRCFQDENWDKATILFNDFRTIYRRRSMRGLE